MTSLNFFPQFLVASKLNSKHSFEVESVPKALTVQRHICQSMSGLSLPISVFPFLDGMHHRCNLGFFSSSHFNAVHSCLTHCFVWPKFKITG